MNDGIPVAVVVPEDYDRKKDDLEWGEQQGVVQELQNNALPDFKPEVVRVERKSDAPDQYSGACICIFVGLGGLIYGLFLFLTREGKSEKDGKIVAAVCGVLILLYIWVYADQSDFPEENKKDALWVSGENETRELLAVTKAKNPDVILSFTCKCNLSLGLVEEVLEPPTCFDYSPNIRFGNGEKPVLKLNFKPNIITLDMETNYFIEMKKQQAKDQGHVDECLESFETSLKEAEDIPPFVLIDRNNRNYAEKFSYVKFKKMYNLGCGGCYMDELHKLIEEKNFPLTKIVSLKNVEELLESFPELNETYQVTV